MDIGPPFGTIGNLKRSSSDWPNSSFPGANRNPHSRDRSIRSGFAIPRTPFLRVNKTGKACGGRATREIAVVENDGETAPPHGRRRPSRHRCQIGFGRCVAACTFQLPLEVEKLPEAASTLPFILFRSRRFRFILSRSAITVFRFARANASLRPISAFLCSLPLAMITF